MIYVDALQDYPLTALAQHARHCGRRWSHLWTEPGNEEELHAFAAALGLKREWFQDKPGFPHYDVTPKKRDLALRAGVAECDLTEWLAGKETTV